MMAPTLASFFTVLMLGMAAGPAASAAAQSTDGPRRVETVGEPILQKKLASSHAGFQIFQSRAGGEWRARFDERTGAPTLIYGSGIPLGGPVRSMAAARAAAESILSKFPELWGSDLKYFVPAGELKSGPLFVITWKQQFDGLDVDGGRIQIQIHEAGRVCAISATGVPIREGFSRNVAFGPEEAEAIVKKGKSIGKADAFSAVDIVIYQKPAPGGAEPRVAYVVEAKQPSTDTYERIFVDANDGAVLEVAPLRYEFGGVKGKVTGHANNTLSALGATAEVPIEGILVTVPGLGSSITDKNGDYNITSSSAVPVTVKLALKGPSFDINNAAGTDFTLSQTTASPLNGTIVHNVVINNPPTEFLTSQVTGATELMYIKKYVESEIPSFVHYSDMPVTVNISATCNAFYNNGTINFYASGGNCPNTAFSTVVYHEYGHGVDDYFGGITSGSLSEAIGDIVAMYKSGQPIVGQDFKGLGTMVRTGENTQMWPASNCGGEVHCVGQTFMGFAWQLYKKLQLSLGAQAGAEHAETIVLGTFPFNNNNILDAVDQVFLLDDDDGDITNGSPHYTDLAAAAAMKGFSPPQLKPIIVTHEMHPDTWNQTQPYPIYAFIQFNASTVFSVDLDYNVDGVVFGSVPMTPFPSVPGVYKATIPPVVGPKLISYSIRAVDSAFNIEIAPGGEGAYRFGVGKKTTIFAENFDSGATSMTHSAVSGIDDWQIGAPQTAGTNNFDAKKAVSLPNCAGTDLQINAGDDGKFTNSSERSLETPSLNAAALTGVRARFRRWLTVEGSQFDQAGLYANGNLIYINSYSGSTFDSNWTLQDYPLNVDNVANFTAKWALKSDNAVNYGGWNLDDITIYALESTPVLSLNLTTNPISYLGQNFSMQMNGTPGASWELFVSLTDVPFSIEGFGTLGVGADTLSWFTAGTLNGAGQDILSFPMPYEPILIGYSFYWIAGAIKPGANWQISNIVKTTWQ